MFHASCRQLKHFRWPSLAIAGAAVVVSQYDFQKDSHDRDAAQVKRDSNVWKIRRSLFPSGQPFLPTVSIASCEDDVTSYEPFMPLDADIDAVVDEILRDPTINLTLIPDSIERRVYKSTIQLTLSMVYDTIVSIHGTELFSHEIHLRRLPHDPNQETALYKDRKINDDILEEVAERLLANQAINSSLIPDNIEKQIYVNCIKIIFRTLHAVFDGFCLQICGHEFRISLKAAEMERAAVAASMSVVDLDLLRQYARDHAGVQDDAVGFWDSLFLRREFTAQLHAALYGLVLGIIDDILANTKIQLLGDTMELDIVPMSETKRPTKAPADNEKATPAVQEKAAPDAHGSSSVPVFAAGVGVGAAIVTLATLVSAQR